MTEKEWAACADPKLMLSKLRERGKEPDRRLRLFAAACCRSVWHLLRDTRSRAAVEVAERYAEGEAGLRELAEASCAAAAATGRGSGKATHAAHWSVKPNLVESIVSVCEAAAEGMAAAAQAAARAGGADLTVWEVAWNEALGAEAKRQADLLRDVCGNPYRRSSFDPAWGTRTAVAIARLIYDERDFGLLPVLADALEDAGCEDAAVLDHCRRPAEHVRGCWVVDLLRDEA